MAGDTSAAEHIAMRSVDRNNLDSSASEQSPTVDSPSQEANREIKVDEEESTALLESSEERMTSSPHSSHSHSRNDKSKSTLPCLIMIVLTFLFFVVELVFGFVNRSIALLADSYHMLSDVFALTVALVCLWIANRPSKYSTFGWVRSEVFGALINGVWLITMCYTVALESIGRIINPRAISHPLQASKPVLIVGTIGLLINCIGIFVFHSAGVGHSGHSHDKGHGHSHEGEEESDEEDEVDDTRARRTFSQLSNQCHNHMAMRLVNLNAEDAAKVHHKKDKKAKDKKNLNMHGAFLHIITDAVGSIIVIISAGIVYFFSNQLGKVVLYLDPVLSLCLVSIISVTAIRLVRQTSEVILRLCPSFVDEEELSEQIMKVQGVAKVEKISCWTLVANRHLSTAEIEFCTASSYDLAVPRIRKIFHRHGIHSLTIQPTFTCESTPREEITESPEASVSQS